MTVFISPPPNRMAEFKQWLYDFGRAVHGQNVSVGWWDEWAPDLITRHQTAMMLVYTELAEAAEGARKDLMDDHLLRYPMFDVELADALIRLVDCRAAYGNEEFQTGWERKFEQFGQELILKRNKLEQLHFVASKLSTGYSASQQIDLTLCAVLALACVLDIDIVRMAEMKHHYNRDRLDHKQENRAKVGGKRW